MSALFVFLAQCGYQEASKPKQNSTHTLPQSSDATSINLNGFPCEISEDEMKFSLQTLKEAGYTSQNLINQERQFFHQESSEAHQLEWEDRLWKLAICHAKDMCDQNYFSHINKKGLSPFQRAMQSLGTVYLSFGENISSSFDTSKDYESEEQRIAATEKRHLAYMDECVCGDGCSEKQVGGHRKNILDSDFTHIGVGVWFCRKNETWYEAQNFWRIDMTKAHKNTYCKERSSENPPEIFSVLK